jgi:hypothetical protein
MNPSVAKPTWERPILPGALCLRGHKSETPSRSAGYCAHTEGKRKIHFESLYSVARGNSESPAGLGNVGNTEQSGDGWIQQRKTTEDSSCRRNLDTKTKTTDATATANTKI